MAAFLCHAQIQNLKFIQLGINDGLSQNTVTCILQDHQGFIWIGTGNGLNKYDGYGFAVYRNNLNDKGSLSNNVIRDIIEDAEGNIWIATDGGGLNRLDRAREKFISYKHENHNATSIVNNYINNLTLDSNGNLWIGTDGTGLDCYNKKENNFIHYVHDKNNIQTLSSNYILHTFEDSQHNLWVGTRNGLNLFDRENQTFKSFLPDDKKIEDAGSNMINVIDEDSKQQLWIGTNGGGLNLFDRNTHKFLKFRNDPSNEHSLSHNVVLSLKEDSKGNLWVGTENGGLSILDNKAKTFQTYKQDHTDKASLSNNSIWSIFKDMRGNMWLGTFSGGISFYNLDANKFTHYRHNDSPQSLSNNTVFSILEDSQNNLWIATDGGGLDLRGHNSTTFKHFRHNKQNKNSIAGDNLLKVFEDSEGNLWIGTWGDGITVFNPKKNTYRTYENDPLDSTSLSINSVWTFCEDADNNIWIGTFGGGLDLYNKRTDNFIHYRHDETNNESIIDNTIRALETDNDGNLWIGTSNGLSKLNRTTKKFSHFRDDGSKNSIRGNVINYINKDSHGNLWIGSKFGFSNLNIKTNQITNFSIKDGLSGEEVFGILEDSHGNLWISTNDGLSKFNPLTKVFKNFSIADGLQSPEFKQSCYRGHDGKMYFGGINGFNEFFPDSIKNSNYNPPLVFTSFQIFNKPVPSIKNNKGENKNIAETKKITLTYKQSVISFEFASLDYIVEDQRRSTDMLQAAKDTTLNFTNTVKNQYAYKLEGFDNDWNFIGKKRSVTYTNLDAGEYTLKVKASNNDGAWNENVTSLELIITPPFWKTWWAYIIYTILVFIALYIFRKYSIIQIEVMNSLMIERLENKKITEIAEAKMRFFTNISHEIRTPLTMISSPLENILTEDELAPKTRKNLSSVSKNVKRLLNLTNQILQFRKLDQGYLHLNTSATPLIPFINELLEYFEQQAILKNINISVENRIDKEINLWLDREMITTVFYNLLANALKFTEPDGSITIKIFEDIIPKTGLLNKLKNLFFKNDYKNAIAIEVSDTGKGILVKELKNIFKRFYQVEDKLSESPGSGIGLSLVKEYVELHKGHIDVKSKLQQGTSFTVYFPNNIIIEKSNSITPDIQPENKLDELMVRENILDEDNGITLPLVLVVEDDVELSDHLSELLSKSFRVESANNGKTGLEKALDILPDLIISDVAMPEMDGFELCKTLKYNIVTSHIPIILLTAKASEENIMIGFNYGADAYIPKPFNFKIVESQGKSLIRTRELLREKYKKLMLIEPSDIVIESPDEEFLKKLMEIIESNIENSSFDVPTLAAHMGMSRSALFKKIKSLTGFSIVEFIQKTRLKRAAMIFRKEKLSVSDVGFRVGFSDLSYFSRCFTKEFGKTPTDYLNEQNP